MYQVIGFEKTTEEDNYTDGIISDCSTFSDNHINWTDETLEGLYKQLQEFVCCDEEAFHLDDLYDGLYASVMEDADGMNVSIDDPQWEQFKAGTINLYSARYKFDVIKTENVSKEMLSELNLKG